MIYLYIYILNDIFIYLCMSRLLKICRLSPQIFIVFLIKICGLSQRIFLIINAFHL